MPLDSEQCNEGNNGYRKSHLTKNERSPKLYRDVARVLQNVKSKKANIKTALYSANIRRIIFDKVYAMTCSVLKHMKVIDKVIEDVELLVKEPRLNLELAEILIHEMCVAQRSLIGNSKPVLVVQKYQENIEKSFVKQSSALCLQLGSNEEEESFVPRYARVNTLVTDVFGVISALRKKHFYEVVYDDKITLDQYHEKVKQLQPYEFLIDFHFKDLLVFQRYQNLCHFQLYQNGHIFLQDKSSYIPVHVLSPSPGSEVFDTCAAPGMKTVHIAACMNNSGKIFATDSDEKRFTVLKETLKRAQVEICKSCCCNFTDTDSHDEQFSSVEYILVDPSCSGSGMVNRMDHVTDDKQSKSEDRLRKLAGFQVVLLKHALSFPSVKRIVYSTCSVSEIENEYVVHEALSHYQHLFRLVPALPEWPTRGQGEYEFSHLCLRSFPESNLTNGFFVAVFERLQDVQTSPKNDNSENTKIRSEVINGQENAENLPADYKVLSGSEETRICKIEDSVSHTPYENISKKHKRKHKSVETYTVTDSLDGINHNAYEESGNNCNESHCAKSTGQFTESVPAKKHKKRKHRDYDLDNSNHDFQEMGRTPDKLCDMKENAGESVVVKKHKKKKVKDLDKNHSNCDVHHIVGTNHDKYNAEGNVEECDGTTVLKRHKKKKHKGKEHNSSDCILPLEHSDVKENLEGCSAATVLKCHKKKKHRDTEYNSSDCSNLHLEHGDVQENLEGCRETAVVKSHKKKKHRDIENISDCNLHLEQNDVEENVEGSSETTVAKRHKKKKHRDAEPNSSDCSNLHLEHGDVKENLQGCTETTVMKSHKKKHRDVEHISDCNLHLEQNDVEANVEGSSETTVAKRHKKKHRDIGTQ